MSAFNGPRKLLLLYTYISTIVSRRKHVPMTFVAGFNYVSSRLIPIHSTNYFRDIACMGETINVRRYRSENLNGRDHRRNAYQTKLKLQI